MYTPTAPEILIIERDPRTADTVMNAARTLGLHVRLLEHARDAEQLMADREPRLVVVDERTPAPYGERIADYILSLDPEAELVLMSDSPSLEGVLAALRTGVRDLLQKPLIDEEILKNALRAAVDRLEKRRVRQAEHAQLRVEALAAAAVLDRLHLCIILTDAEGFVKYRNRSAARLLANGHVLRVDPDGRVGCARGASRRLLWECIANAAQNAGSPRAVRLAGEEAGLELGLAAIGVDGPEPRNAYVALLLEGAERPVLPPNSPAMRTLYGLTPAEAKVVARLALGESLQDACDELAITIATGRTHLARAFVKTRTSRQGELISLLWSGPALLVEGQPPSERRGAAVLAG